MWKFNQSEYFLVYRFRENDKMNIDIQKVNTVVEPNVKDRFRPFYGRLKVIFREIFKG